MASRRLPTNANPVNASTATHRLKKHVKKKVKSKSKRKEDDDLTKGYIFPIHFMDATKAVFNLLDLMIGTPVMLVDTAKFVQHIFEFVELDVVYKELYNRLEMVDLDELMILWDPMQKYGASYCVVINSIRIASLKKFHGLEAKAKRTEEDDKVDETKTDLEISEHHKLSRWLSMGSSLDVDGMVIKERDKIAKIRYQTETKHCNLPYNWTDVSIVCCCYESEPKLESGKFAYNLKYYRDHCSQVTVGLSNVAIQAGYTQKINASTQTAYQILTEEEIEIHLRHPDLPKFLHKVLPKYEKVLTVFSLKKPEVYLKMSTVINFMIQNACVFSYCGFCGVNAKHVPNNETISLD